MVARAPDGVNLGRLAALNCDARGATEKTRDYRGKAQSGSMIERAIGALAESQHGVVAIWQLLALGLRPDAIQYRVSIGPEPSCARKDCALRREACMLRALPPMKVSSISTLL